MLTTYLEGINLAISMQNGLELTRLFSSYDAKLIIEECQRLKLNVRESLESFRNDLLGHPYKQDNESSLLWRDVITSHIRLIILLGRYGIGGEASRQREAFNEAVFLVQTLQRIFQSTSRWLLPLVYLLNDNLWQLALTLSETEQEQSARIINKCVTICLTDRSAQSQSRKWGSYRTIALLFRIYFHLGQLNLCGNLLRAMGAADLLDPNRYPPVQMVTFRYWLGKYYFVNEQWEQAEIELSLAWEYCPAQLEKNKRMMLHYLIPLRLHCKGDTPKHDILLRYGMTGEFYVDALLALRRGDLRSYRFLLTKYEKSLLKLGTFLLWERLIFIVYRNLFRKIYILNGTNTRIPLGLLLAPFKSLGIRSDEDEIACFVANLVAKGMIRGYLSLEKAMLVLSQKDPFPLKNKTTNKE